MSISNEYYEQKLQELFKDCPENHQIIVANSKVFQVISKRKPCFYSSLTKRQPILDIIKAEIEEYLKQTKKNSKLKLNDQIKQMFNEAKYHEVVGEFADFPEIHNLVRVICRVAHHGRDNLFLFILKSNWKTRMSVWTFTSISSTATSFSNSQTSQTISVDSI